jgi:CGNR zinc finger protein
MRFDSHVADLLHVSAGLVNLLTSTEAGGREWQPPTGTERRRALGEVLVRDGRAPEVTDEDDRLLTRFAEEARQVFEAVAGQDVDQAAARVNELVAWCRPQPRLDRFEDGWHLHFHGTTDDLGVGWTAGCAAALTMAVGSAGAGRLGVCEAPRCDRVYVDHSKNGTRRFCGTPCQNRVKNAHYRRSGGEG